MSSLTSSIDGTWAPLPAETASEIVYLFSDINTRPSYETYTGNISYYVRKAHSAPLTRRHFSEPITRHRVTTALNFMHCLRQHLNANLDLLREYGESVLSSAPSPTDLRQTHETPLQTAQASFAMHHISISENLRLLEDSNAPQLGVPTYHAYKDGRNFFAHNYGTPSMMGACSIATEVKGSTEMYERLLELVDWNANWVGMQLADQSKWSPPVKKPTVPPRQEQMVYSTQDYSNAQQASSEGSNWTWQNLRAKIDIPNPFKWFCYVPCVRSISSSLENWLRNTRESVENQNIDWTQSHWEDRSEDEDVEQGLNEFSADRGPADYLDDEEGIDDGEVIAPAW